jgi:membrane protein implicated in regulation of membrane protease activity
MFGFLLAWYNLPFIAGLGCFLALALLQIIGGFGDQDADADADADLDVDVDADVDADIDVDADADADADVASGDGGMVAEALSALGIGRVPLMLVLMAFLGSFGVIGLLANTLLVGVLGSYPNAALIPMLLGVVLLGLILTGRISRLLGRLTPRSSTATSFDQLVGRVGVVVSHSVSPSYGRVQVRDTFGTLHTVYAVIDGGEPLPERSEVALLTYDAIRRCFVVRGLDRSRRG